MPFYEPGLQELLTKHVESGRLRFTDSAQEAAEFGDVHFICVGTPQLPESLGADLSQVDGAVELLGPHLTRPTVVVGKSTVPVGTAPRLAARLAELAPAGADAELVWNPEFLREGFAVEDTLRPNRLVIGGASAHAEKVLREVYADALGHGVPLVVTDYATAELVKASANAFLATKISFINAVAEMCEVTGADVVDLADALGHDDRIGRKFLNAGIGFGGGCLPKDIRAFLHRAGELGVDGTMTFLRHIDEINQNRREHVVNIATSMLDGSLGGARIAVWGAAFKPDSDDVRDSPALWIAGQLHLRGAQVSIYDPKAGRDGAGDVPHADLRHRRRRLRPRRRPAAAPHGVEGVPRRRPRRARRGRRPQAGARRPQLPRLRGLARRRLDGAGPRPPLSLAAADRSLVDSSARGPLAGRPRRFRDRTSSFLNHREVCTCRWLRRRASAVSKPRHPARRRRC